MSSLRYLSALETGYQRLKQGKHFKYVDSDGQLVSDVTQLDRIHNLHIPPAWKNVIISPLSNTHLQAVGFDAKGRKQYRYHPEWEQLQQQHKFDKLVFFGEQLPAIRHTIKGHLQDKTLSKQKVVAAIIAVMEETLIRVGNDEYARDNHSYGLTTLRNRHVAVSDGEVTFDFTGKSGVDHVITIDQPKLVAIIKACQEIPGYELFQYVDEQGQHHDIHSDDVNEYLRAITTEPVTAKDFRTWGGTVLATQNLYSCEPCAEAVQLKKNVVSTVKQVAEHLGNRPATCRKYYIHPVVPETYLAAKLPAKVDTFLDHFKTQPYPGLKRFEFATLELVRG